jgi:hypothetical protein
MTRKDYVLIADVLADLRETYGDHPAVISAAYRFAAALGRDNPRFDRDRFLVAAGQKMGAL